MVSPAIDYWLELGQLSVHIGDDEVRVEGPGPNPGAHEVEPTPQALREWVRTDDRGRYRPLSGARTMRSNWHARFPDLESFTAAIAEVYPLAFEHIALAERGELRVVGLDEVLARQSGRYRVADELSAEGRRLAAGVLCARCVRRPLWRRQLLPALDQNPIPCPEPCSVLVSLCREAALWEKDRPAPSQVDPGAPFADFEVPGNEVREAFLRAARGEA